jgi:competence CoiA-like predicted nuclease
MLIGIVNNKRESAEPGIKATCPLCGKELIPKCGSIKIWHFAHKIDNQCDNWYEPESDWHFTGRMNFR